MQIKSVPFVAAAVAALSAAPAFAATLSNSTGYALTNNGNSLVVFNNLADLSDTTTLLLSGSGTIDALAWRPVTQQLYGYASKGDDAVFVIDTMTGVATNTNATIGSGVAIDNSAGVGFDFNNTLDAARAVSTREDNAVFVPGDTIGTLDPMGPDGRVFAVTDLAYSDSTGLMAPDIFANAYTNAVNGMLASTTLQYGLDSANNSLVTIANNAGTLETVGALVDSSTDQVLDISGIGGLEILSDFEGDNLALALLNFSNGSTAGLFEIDLSNGRSTRLGDANAPGVFPYIGFAASTAPAPVPVPASGLMLVAALGGLGALRRKMRKA
ncbi:DUF4394 domain-containing protein [Pseudoroseicyclus aestuarii]|uniref:Putative secreted protein n=1 Tax=Pseudoroseicyclus aestuarii TaxID=1795041 RepID=A0A318SZJ6_9RHOB|nr:DUF4394 domain-containing protein [Pseudoroseicyclus aestuarii]PYE85799.1 putative secreted protein [Pseudoroseicyclus aestuarii]